MHQGQSFTTDDFLHLMSTSPVVKSMKPIDVYVLIQLAMDPESQRTKNIFAILQEEQKRIDYAEKTFGKIADDVMNEMQAGITDVKVKNQKEKLEKMSKNIRREEEQEAEKLLQSIKK